jgi:NADPH:quinone reductase-like Zn-dependent oxidoreductase
VGIAGITALQGLRDKGNIRQGQRVLINGAAGGVGTFAVQIAKALEAHVTAVCSTRNVEFVRSIGADDAIDYTREDFIHGSRRYDVLFDLVGNHPLPACLRVLEPRGIYIGCGGGGPDRSSVELLGSMLHSLVLGPFTSRKLPGLLAKVNTADLNAVVDLMRTGKVTPVLDRSYALKETANAIRYIEQGHARGKVAITVP